MYFSFLDFYLSLIMFIFKFSCFQSTRDIQNLSYSFYLCFHSHFLIFYTFDGPCIYDNISEKHKTKSTKAFSSFTMFPLILSYRIIFLEDQFNIKKSLKKIPHNLRMTFLLMYQKSIVFMLLKNSICFRLWWIFIFDSPLLVLS